MNLFNYMMKRIMTKLLFLIIFSLMNYVINSFAFTYPELKLISMVWERT